MGCFHSTRLVSHLRAQPYLTPSKWGPLGGLGGQFWFLRVPDHLATEKNIIWIKENSQKMCFLAVFESHFGHFVCKMGPNGDFGGGGLEGSKN